MFPEIPTSWLYPPSLEAAADIQRMLAQRVVAENAFDTLDTLGGVDVSQNLRDPTHHIYAAMVTLGYDQCQVMASASIRTQNEFPYIPGFLAFREVPALLQAYQQLTAKPDVFLVDGHGISHPRGLGIASHLGVLLDCPSIGVAKSILVGKPQGLLGLNLGDQVPLVWRGQRIGIVLRTKARSNPVYISVGHKIDLETAIEVVLHCLLGYRLPEPTRQAHLAANAIRKQDLPVITEQINLLNP